MAFELGNKVSVHMQNHDTGSTQAHWPFPYHAIQQGYCYILTHPGTPTVFYDHLHDQNIGHTIKELIRIRKENKLHVRSKVKILRADALLYVAEIDDKLIMKIGPDHFDPGEGWGVAGTGNCWCVWEHE
jgi:alpha-amylase